MAERDKIKKLTLSVGIIFITCRFSRKNPPIPQAFFILDLFCGIKPRAYMQTVSLMSDIASDERVDSFACNAPKLSKRHTHTGT